MSSDIKSSVPRHRSLRVLNRPQRDLLQGLLFQIPFNISLYERGGDGLCAMMWIDDAIDEAFLQHPKAYKLKIYLLEAERRTSRDPDISEKIRAIVKYLDE